MGNDALARIGVRMGIGFYRAVVIHFLSTGEREKNKKYTPFSHDRIIIAAGAEINQTD